MIKKAKKDLFYNDMFSHFFRQPVSSPRAHTYTTGNFPETLFKNSNNLSVNNRTPVKDETVTCEEPILHL